MNEIVDLLTIFTIRSVLKANIYFEVYNTEKVKMFEI